MAHGTATIEEILEPDIDSEDPHNVHNTSLKHENVIDLYSVGHEVITRDMCNKRAEIPFKHTLQLKGPQGEVVRVSALFDGAVMTAAMCQSLLERVQHRLGTWKKLEKLLRMANGVIIPSQAVWSGRMQLGDIEVEGSFEVFDSRGGWAFLLGKPLLQLFNARQEFTSDMVTIGPNSIVLHNEMGNQGLVMNW